MISHDVEFHFLSYLLSKARRISLGLQGALSSLEAIAAPLTRARAIARAEDMPSSFLAVGASGR